MPHRPAAFPQRTGPAVSPVSPHQLTSGPASPDTLPAVRASGPPGPPRGASLIEARAEDPGTPRALICHGRAGDHWHGSAQAAGDVRGQGHRRSCGRRAGPARRESRHAQAGVQRTGQHPCPAKHAICGIMWVIFGHLRPPGHIMPDHAGDRGAVPSGPAPRDHLHINQLRMFSGPWDSKIWMPRRRCLEDSG